MSKLLCDYCRHKKPEHHRDCPAIHKYAKEMYGLVRETKQRLEADDFSTKLEEDIDKLLKRIDGE